MRSDETVQLITPGYNLIPFQNFNLVIFFSNMKEYYIHSCKKILLVLMYFISNKYKSKALKLPKISF